MVDTPPLRKFMFDRSFDGNASANPRPRGPVTLKPEQVDALKKEAYDQGFAAGKTAGVSEQEQFLRLTLTQLDQNVNALVANLQALHQQQDAHMRAAVLAIARKMLPDLIARNGVQEIQAMLNDVIGEMAHEPRLVVRVNEADFDTVNARINEITAQKAYPGKVVVLADAETARGDCRVEWADGGVERNAAATWQAIEEAVAPATNETLP